jgi:hypothetical protein
LVGIETAHVSFFFNPASYFGCIQILKRYNMVIPKPKARIHTWTF